MAKKNYTIDDAPNKTDFFNIKTGLIGLLLLALAAGCAAAIVHGIDPVSYVKGLWQGLKI